jgi:hypothetical protein
MNDERKFVWIYVDGERKLIPLESIYIPRFEEENTARQAEGGSQSSG